ncbi:MAG: helix-hairpin-helix domain-containing protein [Coxiellaceae bacterium]|nr:helix-hairpin-helix domain-containing protein [Coxiellaceae bacterium]
MKITTGSLFLLACGFSVLSASPLMAASKASTQKSVKVQALKQININKADAKTLAVLKGIGIKRAQAIVAYRQKHGKYTSVDQLSAIRGISANSLAKIKARNSVKLLLK